MKLVKDFESDELNLDRNNYAINIITLTSKDTKAKHLKKFRPIIVVLRFFANALNNRLIKIADRLICANQTTFIKRRFILESMIESGLILKLDYEKAYDRVSWGFIKEMLRSRGFGAKWKRWFKNVIQGGSICIRINDKNSAYFKPRKVLGKETLYPQSYSTWLLTFSQ